MNRFSKILFRAMLLMFCFISIACTTQNYKERIQSVEPENHHDELPETIKLLSWNIGFGALGKDADFFPDGGKSIFPSNRKLVAANCKSIMTRIEEIDPDIIFFQEMAGDSSMTHGINLFDTFRRRLTQYTRLFFVPKHTNFAGFLNLNIGYSIFSKIKFDDISLIKLGVVKQHPLGPEEFHHLVKSTIAISPDKKLILYLLHLPALDKKAESRSKHIQILKDDILSEYNAGNMILCAGDWNLKLAPVSFKNTTKVKYTEWVFDLPQSFTPPGWEWQIDPAIPTVRTLERPYREGENYTTIIDGILTSPGIVVQVFRTFDYGFENSDHNPVYTEFRVR